MNKLEIISVNYNTPDLIERLIKSIIQFEGIYPMRIIDGSDREPFKSQVLEIAEQYENVNINQFGYNIHHGRGMDWGLSTCQYDFALIIDSDQYMVQTGLFNQLTFNYYYEGFAEYVNKGGSNISKSDEAITYLHPRFLLVDVNHYKESLFKFIHDGAPAINIMINETNIKAIDEKYRHYYAQIGMGTRSRFGCKL